jgi:hypothetical protein
VRIHTPHEILEEKLLAVGGVSGFAERAAGAGREREDDSVTWFGDLDVFSNFFYISRS